MSIPEGDRDLYARIVEEAKKKGADPLKVVGDLSTITETDTLDGPGITQVGREQALEDLREVFGAGTDELINEYKNKRSE